MIFGEKKISLKSVTQRTNPVSSNYWCNLIFKILELKCKDVDLNCIISKNNLIVKKINEKYKKNKFLDELDIVYDAKNMLTVENARNAGFESSRPEMW